MITTKRMELKILKARDAQIVLEFILRNKIPHEQFEVLKPDSYYTLKTIKQILEIEFNDIEKGSMLRLYMFEKNNPDKVIGMLNFSQIIRGGFNSCYLGYRVDKDYEGKGYMKEAIQDAVAYVFKSLMLHRIEANIMPWNIRSINLIKSLGFEFEGLSKKYLKINGNWEDHEHYVLLNKDVE
jgi:ribosomal-protein-alanine N-acetyltransferase